MTETDVNVDTKTLLASYKVSQCSFEALITRHDQ